MGRTCPVEIVEAFRELDFVEFEGRTYDEIAALYPEVYRQWMEWPAETQFPGGESFRGARGALRFRNRPPVKPSWRWRAGPRQCWQLAFR